MKSQVGFVSSLLFASGIARANDFSGTISGNATVPIGRKDLAIVGMKVELLKVGGLEPLQTDYTGEGGAFALNYFNSDTADSIDLYLKFTAATEYEMIRVRKNTGGIVSTRDETFFEDDTIKVVAGDSESGIVDVGDLSLDPDETRPQLLHWANRARKFVNDELGEASPLPTIDEPSKKLDIMDSPVPWVKDGGFFFPGMYIDEMIAAGGAVLTQLTGAPPGLWILGFGIWFTAAFSDNDCIYLGKDAHEDDGTVFHEFGHYFMLHAQGEKWLNPVTASFANHSAKTNASNPKIAWTEGWAKGFGFIVDAATSNDDDEVGGGESPHLLEDPGAAGTIECKGGGTACSQQAVTHGFYSESYIGSTLYDLWDGRDNLSRLSAPPDYDDDGNDAIELSFAELATPILDTETGAQSDLIANIVDYHDRLTDLDLEPVEALADEPGLDRALTELFTFDKIRNLAPQTSGTPQVFADLLNTDAINFSREVEVQTFKEKGGTFKEANRDTATFTVDAPKLSGPDDTFNFCSTGSGDVWGPLVDDLIITGTTGIGAAELRINSSVPRGWQSAGNTYGAPEGAVACGAADFAVSVAGNMELTVIDQGQITIGQSAAGRTTDVTLEEGSTLILGGGLDGDNPSEEYPGGPLVSKGKLFIDEGSRLVVERGASLIIKQGAEITLDGSDLVIRGNLVVEPDATFQWTALNGGMVTFDLEDVGGEPNVTMEPSSKIFISETEFTIASGTYVRPTSDNHGPRTIVIEHGATGHFGADAYLDTTGTILTLEESTIEALSPPDKHNGVRLDDNPEVIDGMTFSGGWTCIEELGSVPGIQDALLIQNSDFADCTIAIAVDNRSLELSGVTIDDGVTGVSAFAVPNVSVAFSEIKGQTDRGLEMVQSSGATITDSTFLSNNVGIDVDNGALLRLDGATIAQNSVGVFASDGATVNAGVVAGVPSLTLFDRNRVSIRLEDAALPVLAGDNSFFPATGAGVRSISGTVDDSGTACVADTLYVGDDLWHTWGGPVVKWTTVWLVASPYSISSSAGGCGFTYTLVQ